MREPVVVVIRPEDIEFKKPEEGALKGTVRSILFKGVHYEIKIQTEKYEFLAHSTESYQPGTQIGIYVKPENIQIMHKPQSEDEEIASENEEAGY